MIRPVGKTNDKPILMSVDRVVECSDEIFNQSLLKKKKEKKEKKGNHPACITD